MTQEEIKLSEEAIRFVREEKNQLFKRFVDPQIHQPAETPISLFMAGSPGAGKTEVSKRLAEQFAANKPIRIDADDIRNMFPGYTGANSHIFQKAASKGVDKLYDYVIDHKINVIMDSTFSSEESLKAIERSIKHGRKVIIYFIYQDPILAWKFTKAREAKEGRKISKEVFVRAFVGSHKNVNKTKECFKDKVELNLIIKDFDKEIDELKQNIIKVDEYLPMVYTVDNLNTLLDV